MGYFTGPSAAELSAANMMKNKIPLYQVSLFIEPSDTSDKSICLVDLDAATSAHWAHSAGTSVVLHRFFMDVDRGSFTGDILLGWVRENDDTDGSIYIIRRWNLSDDLTIDIDFGRHPIICNTDYQKAGSANTYSGNYTVLQNDEDYGFTQTSTGHKPAANDLVLIYDYAGADVTSLTVQIQYSML